MEATDFEMPSPKRQRTESPAEARNAVSTDHRPTSKTVDAIQNGGTSNTAATLPGLGMLDQEDASNSDNILDALMMHVESESMPQNQALPQPEAEHEEAEPKSAEDAMPIDNHVPEQQPSIGSTQIDEAQAHAFSVDAESMLAAAKVKPTDEEMQDAAPTTATETNVTTQEDGAAPATVGTEAKEWETDSSPYTSSTDTSSDSDSDNDSDDSDDGEPYTLLSARETARLLMAESGGAGGAGSDDEDEAGPSSGNKSSANAGLRTVHEMAEFVPPVPDVTITPEMTVEELGSVTAVVENTILITAKTSGEYQVLENNSLLCTESRLVVGVVAETLGRVEQPLYTVRFATEQDVQNSGIAAIGTKVFFVKEHSTFVFTQPLKAVKGSDASNFHDEEVGDDEMEFSDDEAEAEHKRLLKAKKKGLIDPTTGQPLPGRGGKGGARGRGGRGGLHAIPEHNAGAAAYGNGSLEMNYDEVEEGEDTADYKPLQRPAELMNGGATNSTEPIPGLPLPPNFSNTQRGGNSYRGNRGGRNNRGNFRGRGSGRGTYQNNNTQPHQSSYTPQQPYQPNFQQSFQQPFQQQQYQPNQAQPQQPFPFSFSPATFQNQSQQPPQMPNMPNVNFAQLQQAMYAQQQQMQAQHGQQQYGAPPPPPQEQQQQWSMNADAMAQVQRHFEELRRANQGGAGGQGQ